MKYLNCYIKIKIACFYLQLIFLKYRIQWEREHDGRCMQKPDRPALYHSSQMVTALTYMRVPHLGEYMLQICGKPCLSCLSILDPALRAVNESVCVRKACHAFQKWRQHPPVSAHFPRQLWPRTLGFGREPQCCVTVLLLVEVLQYHSPQTLSPSEPHSPLQG